MSDFRVLIAGSGLGGLTLAQSLRRQGVEFSIYERDASPWARPQGYRLHLDADALNAVSEVLPDELYHQFDVTAFRTTPFTTMMSTDLSVVKRFPTSSEHDAEVWPAAAGDPGHANVDRALLRSILLSGLGDDVHFGKQLSGYESTSRGTVVARFTDGSRAEGDVLVGADGIRSAVRRQRLPGCDTVDAGIGAIYGRLPLAVAQGLVPEETLADIFTIASDDRKVFLGLGAVQFSLEAAGVIGALDTGAHRPASDGYVVCIVGGRHEYLPGLKPLHSANSQTLQQLALQTIGNWPEPAKAVLEAADPTAFFAVDMYTSVPCALGRPTNVTVLGDAIHAMTPTLGRGANVAMRDGALLGRMLNDVAAGRNGLGEGLSRYEAQMAEYGYRVVRQAALTGQQRMAQNPLPETGQAS